MIGISRTLTAGLAALSLAFAGCQTDDAVEKDVNKAADDVKNSDIGKDAGKAADDVGNAADDAADDVGDELDGDDK